MKIKLVTSLMLLFLLGVQSNEVFAQEKEVKKLKRVGYEVVVEVSPEKAWEVLSSYGDAGSFHSQLESSKSLNGSPTKAALGCDRECIIPDGKKKILVREKIIKYVEGQYYTYNVYEWENFPINTFLVTFGVKTNEKGQTVIYQSNDYRLKPGFLSGIMKGKLKNGSRDGVLAYKHYMETGEKHADMKEIREKYKNL